MWNRDFELAIFNSLEPLPQAHTNECYKAYFNQTPYFVKKIILRFRETIEEAQQRIEVTENIADYYSRHGIKTIVAVRQNGSYTHVNQRGIWAAYPWTTAVCFDSINETICYEVGKLLGQIHQIAPNITYSNANATVKTVDFCWIEPLSDFRISEALDFLIAQEELKNYAKKCYASATKLFQKSHSIVSHCDLNIGNILVDKKELIVIDWELSGNTNPESDLFDVALDWCGFCQCNTKISLFENVIKGYYHTRPYSGKEIHTDLAIETLMLSIIEHISIYILKYIKSNDLNMLKKAKSFLQQFYELKKHELVFKKIIDKYALNL